MILKPEKISKTQKKETVNKLFEYSTPTWDFFLMMALSSIIITIGLLQSNVPVIIGGMLIAPMLYPILSLAMGIVVGYPKLMRRSALVILQSIFAITIISFVVALLFLEKDLNTEITSRTLPNLAFFIIAICSGGAVGYSIAKPNINEVLPGVAITVSLVPPLSVSGIGLAFLKMDFAIGAIGLFFLNLAGIVFAAIFVFAVMNFYETKEQVKKKIRAEEKEIEEVNLEKQQESIKNIEKTLKEATKILKDTKKK
ncbi:TIGR00341 family protein [Candidatus Peregrinibacteria bacterium]|nr:TIGR00341 family protein [Candidatus Peregrinibacteria bacterium]